MKVMRRVATMRTKAPYGSWKSPVTSEVATKGALRLGGMAFGRGEETYWVEGRPAEGGRNVLVREDGEGPPVDVTPKDVNVRTRVHEYGGGAWKILPDANLALFTDFKTQRLYKQSLDAEESAPEPLTPGVEGSALRFADFCPDLGRNRVLCVVEDHRGSQKEPQNFLAAVELDGSCSEPLKLVSGADFYSSPSLNSDGTKLAFVQWDHPSMPWDITSVMVVDLGPDGLPAGEPTLVAGGPEKEEAPQQPSWTPDGRLIYVSDEGSGWWNLFQWCADGESKNICPRPGCEFGGPPWILGVSSYHVLTDDKIICSYSDASATGNTLAYLTVSTGELEEIPIPYETFGAFDVRGDGRLGALGRSAVKPSEIAVQDKAGEWVTKRKSSSLELDPEYISQAKVIKYNVGDDRFSYMYYYSPRNPDYEGSEDVGPPLLVKTHGGPTASTSSSFNPMIQYWTTRGFAVADVNYGGSTGYGREYRELLKGNWGIVDVEDAAAAATYLSSRGMADPKRLAIDGGSAGGYTTLACLTFTDVFSAGCSLYGVASLEALAGDTHKFEKRYLDYLVGPYPEKKDVYKERAPIENLDKLSAPLMLFQGTEDKIVPPNQAESMMKVCVEKGIPAALEMFEGEQHGFRKEENIRRCLDGEYDFFSQVFDFEPAGLPGDFKKIRIVGSL
ncbi:dipeptidyl aminopeptidase [Chloropicon primus]|uniref:Dipeptidyl aminopeptidase n=1 Tax=Chloropicon primus TaxID=1764295 RepID=A0A5B8MNP1_9CHLO|nr:dipeptidyl aminopeptidase [Chloropicon primus]|eukprot:QDZ22143.1 dipeptidyl aminopeptidase [Chloropicon primus]